jgi:DNA-binding NarL/FixJ family response regulator
VTCPNPTHAMRYDGARWSRTCPCASCVEQRGEYFPRASRHANQWHRELDDVAVERALRGDPPARMTKAERLEVARKLTAQGVPAYKIARVVRTSVRTIERYRTEMKAESSMSGATSS